MNDNETTSILHKSGSMLVFSSVIFSLTLSLNFILYQTQFIALCSVNAQSVISNVQSSVINYNLWHIFTLVYAALMRML